MKFMREKVTTKEFYIPDENIRLHAKLDYPDTMPEQCPLVIIIHGFTGHMEERHIIGVMETFLSCGFATLRVEMYGHGQSDGLFENHTLFRWMSNAMVVTDYAKSLDFVTDLYLCGHSQGGLLTALAAGMRPADYKAIIPLSPALFIPERARKGNLLGRSFDPVQIPEYLYDEKWRLHANYMRVAQCIFPEQIYPRFTGPVLLVHGTKDLSVPVEVSIEAKKHFQQCELVLIEGDTHCYDYHLEMLKDAIKAFCQRMCIVGRQK